MPRKATPQKIEGASGAPLRPRAEGDPLVARFLADAASERNDSPNTLLGYARDLGQFAEFTWGSERRPPYPWGDVDRDLARAWLIGLAQAEAEPASIRRKLSALRAFYRFLVHEHPDPVHRGGGLCPGTRHHGDTRNRHARPQHRFYYCHGPHHGLPPGAV